MIFTYSLVFVKNKINKKKEGKKEKLVCFKEFQTYTQTYYRTDK